MGRGRTHHHVAKQKSEGQSRRPIIALDYFFMKMESTPSAHAISEESITCVAVKEDRHQNIMSSVALEKGVEEPWTIETAVKFIDLLGYHEITLKSDTEPAIIAFRNRVAAMCKAEVTTEDAVKGDKETNGLIESAVMLLRGVTSDRTIKCHIESRTQEPLGILKSQRIWCSSRISPVKARESVFLEHTRSPPNELSTLNIMLVQTARAPSPGHTLRSTPKTPRRPTAGLALHCSTLFAYRCQEHSDAKTQMRPHSRGTILTASTHSFNI